MPCRTTSRHATPCHATPHHATPRRTVPHHATPCALRHVTAVVQIYLEDVEHNIFPHVIQKLPASVVHTNGQLIQMLTNGHVIEKQQVKPEQIDSFVQVLLDGILPHDKTKCCLVNLLFFRPNDLPAIIRGG